MLFEDLLWQEISLRNDIQHYQSGFSIFDIPTFDEIVVREAVLNAMCHRDYRLAGSIFIRQFHQKMEIISPGGFPPGIDAQNILWKQSPRNRRIAEALQRCGLVERSGQGADRMFKECIQRSRPLPNFSGTDDYQVYLTLNGEVQDPAFLRFIEKLGQSTINLFSTKDFLVLDLIHKEEDVPENLKDRLLILLDKQIIERTNRGRSGKYILSRALYSFIGKRGTYTRKKGLDRETNKSLILQHLKRFGKGEIREFEQALPNLTRNQVHSLLRELSKSGVIKRYGEKRGSFWQLALL